AMDGLKESKQAVGAATLARVNNLAPPTILDQASRIQFSTRLFNLLVTNIPGPQFPLYLLGRKLDDLFPVAFLPREHALAVAIMSYDGGIDYGLLGDYDALPDIDVIAEGIEDGLAELLEAARSAAGSPGPRRRAEPAAPARGNGAAEATGNGAAEAVENGAATFIPKSSTRPKRGPAADMRAKRTGRSLPPKGPPRRGGDRER
ncbi:MAG TPA: WS/DGAT domain-containing protein, partial [Solirubrobacteraceae bacterium]|nr:WS/DGAT domain-containing protein [Solirubrobacteraceae bacterium]